MKPAPLIAPELTDVPTLAQAPADDAPVVEPVVAAPVVEAPAPADDVVVPTVAPAAPQGVWNADIALAEAAFAQFPQLDEQAGFEIAQEAFYGR
jgi:hypothetical protein